MMDAVLANRQLLVRRLSIAVSLDNEINADTLKDDRSFNQEKSISTFAMNLLSRLKSRISRLIRARAIHDNTAISYVIPAAVSRLRIRIHPARLFHRITAFPGKSSVIMSNLRLLAGRKVVRCIFQTINLSGRR